MAPSESSTTRPSPTPTRTPSTTPSAPGGTPSPTSSLTPSSSAIAPGAHRITVTLVVNAPSPVGGDAAAEFFAVVVACLGWDPESTLYALSATAGADDTTDMTFNLSTTVDLIAAAASSNRLLLRKQRALALMSPQEAAIAANAALMALLEQGTLVTALAAAGLAGSFGYASADDMMAAIAALPVTVVEASPATPAKGPAPGVSELTIALAVGLTLGLVGAVFLALLVWRMWGEAAAKWSGRQKLGEAPKGGMQVRVPSAIAPSANGGPLAQRVEARVYPAWEEQ